MWPTSLSEHRVRVGFVRPASRIMFRIFAESVELAQLRRVSFSEGDQHGVVAACEQKKVRYATLPRTDAQFVLRRLVHTAVKSLASAPCGNSKKNTS